MIKKTKQVNFKISEEQLEELRLVAEDLRLNASQLVSSLVSDFISARRSHGPRLIWPVEFAHFAPQSKIINYQEEQDHYLKVAEEDPGYETEPHMFYEDDAGVLHPVPKGYRPGIDGPPLKPAKFTNDLKTPLKSKK